MIKPHQSHMKRVGCNPASTADAPATIAATKIDPDYRHLIHFGIYRLKAVQSYRTTLVAGMLGDWNRVFSAIAITAPKSFSGL